MRDLLRRAAEAIVERLEDSDASPADAAALAHALVALAEAARRRPRPTSPA